MKNQTTTKRLQNELDELLSDIESIKREITDEKKKLSEYSKEFSKAKKHDIDDLIAYFEKEAKSINLIETLEEERLMIEKSIKDITNKMHRKT